MGKSKRTSSGEMIQRNWDTAVQGQTDSLNRFNENFSGAQERSNTAYNSATSNLNSASGGYQSVLDHFDLSKPGILQSMYGANATKYGTWDPKRVAGIDKSIGGIDKVGDDYHGYISQYDKARRVGNRAYDEARDTGNRDYDEARRVGTERYDAIQNDFSKYAHGGSDQGKYYSSLLNTGGFSESDKADFRGRANSVVPSMFDSLKQENDRLATIQGGINPGYTGQNAKLARDASAAGQEAVTSGEVALQEQIRQGKLQGGEHLDQEYQYGMGGVERALAAKTGIDFDALAAKTGINFNALAAKTGINFDSLAGKLNASAGEFGARNAATGARFNLGNALADSSANLSSRMLEEDKLRGDMVLGGSAGLRGVGDSFTSLRGSRPGEVDMWLDQLQNEQNMYMNHMGQTTNAKSSAEQEKWLKKQKMAKVAAAAVATYYTGGAAAPLLAKAAGESTAGHGAGYTSLQNAVQNAPANSRVSNQVWAGGM